MSYGFSRDQWYNYIADRSHPPVASAVVEKPEYDPDHVYAWRPANNYKGWKLIARGKAGVDDASVIQKALDSLTPNRTWKERVVLKGDFIVNNTILIPDYTILDLEHSYVKLANGVNKPIFKNSGTTGYIDIVGGVLDGNKANNPDSDSHGILILGNSTTYNICIMNVTVKDTYGTGINIVNCKYAFVEGCYTKGTYWHGIRFNAVIHGRIINNTTINSENAQGIVISGMRDTGYETDVGENRYIEIIGNNVRNNAENGIEVLASRDITVLGNSVEYNGKFGIWVGSHNPSGTYIGNVERIEIIGNQVRYNGQIGKDGYAGIQVDADNASYIGAVKDITIEGNIVGLHTKAKQHGISLRFATECKVIGNTVYNNGDRGIRLYCSSDNVIKGNICKNNNQKGTTGDGIRLEDDGTNGCLYNVIVGNRCFDNQDTKTQQYGIREVGVSDFNLIIGNIVVGNAVSGIHKVGANTIVKRNIGYTTENSGSAKVTGNGTDTTFTVDIDHGLVKDKVVAKITLDREGTVDKVYLVDKDGDGFKETLRVVVTYATAPADGEEIPIYWEAEVVS